MRPDLISLVVDTERKDSVTGNGVKVRTIDRVGLSVPLSAADKE